MLLGGNIGLVLPVGIVVCRELPSHIIINGFIMQRAIPILSPLVFMPSYFGIMHLSWCNTNINVRGGIYTNGTLIKTWLESCSYFLS